MDKYIAHFPTDLTRIWQTERPFELHLPSGIVRGRADVILDRDKGKDGRLAIVDYKTATESKTDDLFAFQLAVYAAAGQGEGANVEAAYLHELKESKRVPIPVDSVKQKVARARADLLMQSIAIGEFPHRAELAKCTQCDMKAICKDAEVGKYDMCRIRGWARSAEGEPAQRVPFCLDAGARAITTSAYGQAQKAHGERPDRERRGHPAYRSLAEEQPAGRLASLGKIPIIPPTEYSYSPRRSPELRFDSTGEADATPKNIADPLVAAKTRALTDDEIEAIERALRAEPWLKWAASASSSGSSSIPSRSKFTSMSKRKRSCKSPRVRTWNRTSSAIRS